MAVALSLDERDHTTSGLPRDDNRGQVGCHETIANPALEDRCGRRFGTRVRWHTRAQLRADRDASGVTTLCLSVRPISG